MLKLTGSRTDGTITWMTGAATLGSFTVPTISEAAEAAGRPTPHVVAGMPIWVTDDVDAARAQAAKTFEIYGQLPSCRAMLDREGCAGPADLAIIGDEATCRGASTSWQPPASPTSPPPNSPRTPTIANEPERSWARCSDSMTAVSPAGLPGRSLT
ncbi:MAG: LLM class flavin-dependent oxidoreductase [Acidimicrobiales bacterium]